MKQIKEETVRNVTVLLVKAIHPSYTYETVNQMIKELEQLQPVKEEKEQEDG